MGLPNSTCNSASSIHKFLFRLIIFSVKPFPPIMIDTVQSVTASSLHLARFTAKLGFCLAIRSMTFFQCCEFSILSPSIFNLSTHSRLWDRRPSHTYFLNPKTHHCTVAHIHSYINITVTVVQIAEFAYFCTVLHSFKDCIPCISYKFQWYKHNILIRP